MGYTRRRNLYKKKSKKKSFKRMKGGSVPTFHILLCTAGKPEINAMVVSLKNELLEGDAITIIFDGPTAYATSEIFIPEDTRR